MGSTTVIKPHSGFHFSVHLLPPGRCAGGLFIVDPSGIREKAIQIDPCSHERTRIYKEGDGYHHSRRFKKKGDFITVTLL